VDPLYTCEDHGKYLGNSNFLQMLLAHREATGRFQDHRLEYTQHVHEHHYVVRRFAAQLLVGRSHWLSPCIRSLRLAARLLVIRIAPALLRLCHAFGRAVSTLDLSSVGRIGALAVCPVIPLCVVTTRLAAATDILHLRHASRSFGTSRGLSHGSSSTTLLTPCVRGASARHAARCAQARRRLLRLRRASGCLGTSRGSSRGSTHRSSSTSTTPRVRVPRHVALLVVDFFAYAACPGASARRASRRAVRRQLQLRRAAGCLGTSRGSSRRSLSTSSPALHVWVPRHAARLVVDYFVSRRLVVDYFAYVARLGASARRAARLAACHRLLRLAQARR
jgi:hypothetical protein